MTNEERAARIVLEVLNEPIVACEAITGKGSVNLVFVITTAARQVVVRMREEDARAEYVKESWCYRRAGETGIPGPRVLALGKDAAGEYLVLTRVDGANGEDVADARSLWKTLGGYARRIHAIPVSGFGNLVADAEMNTFGNGHVPSWERQIAYNAAQLTPNDPLISLGVYSRHEQEAVRVSFQALASRRFQFGLNHGDLHPRNVIVSPAGAVSLLDWGCASVHVTPHSDILTLPEWHSPEDSITASFLAGYGLGREEYEALLPDLNRLHLLRAFDVTRWAADHAPEAVPAYAERARRAWAVFSRR